MESRIGAPRSGARSGKSGYEPDAGDIVKIDFDPAAGHEQAGWRPALVLSPKLYNAKTGLAVVVPITNQAKGYTFEVALPASLKVSGVVLVDAIKNVDWRARRAKYADRVPVSVMDDVKLRLSALLDLAEF